MAKKPTPPSPLSGGEHAAGVVMFFGLVTALIFIAVQTSKLTNAEETLQISEAAMRMLSVENYALEHDRLIRGMREEHSDRPPIFISD